MSNTDVRSEIIKKKPVYIGEGTTPYHSTRYASYIRGNEHEVEATYEGPVKGIIALSTDKDNPYRYDRFHVCRTREAEVVESILESDNTNLKNALCDYVKDIIADKRASFKKLENIYEHETLNQSKLAKVRSKLATAVDNVLGTDLKKKKLAKPLKKIEKAVSDKLFGKVKG